MRHPEQSLHQAVARYLDLALPEDAWWSTIPLGGGGRLRGAFLKSMGAKKGTPDLMIVYRGQAHFIELKAPGGRVTPDQVACAIDLERAGAAWRMCRSLEEVAGALELWSIPRRAKVAA